MAGSFKQPPGFDPDSGTSYVDWKNDLKVWCMLTEGKVKQGPAVYLSLQGDARDAVRQIPIAELGGDDGVTKLLTELDKVYLKEETTRAFCAIKAFVAFRRDSGEAFPKFLVDFNNKYREVKKHNLNFDDGILAFFLLMAANLSDDHERLVRATAQLTFEDVKDKLQKVFGEFDNNDGDMHNSKVPVKEECLYTKNFRGKGAYNAYKGQGFVPRGRGSYSRGVGKRGNPRDQKGDVMRCYECDSTMHLIMECPHKQQDSDSRDVYFLTNSTAVDVALMTEDVTGQLMGNTIGYGVLDTACTRTVTGSRWLGEYVSTLTEEEAGKIEESRKVSNAIFKFGDGMEQKSKGKVVIPTMIGKRKVNLEVDVVECDIPLLIGKPSMRRLKMVIDFMNNEVTALGQRIQLRTTKSGHCCIPLSHYVDSCNIVIDSTGLLGTTKEEGEEIT